MPTISPHALPPADVTPDQLERGASLWSDAWHRLKKNRLAVLGGLVLLVLALLCVFGPWFTQSYQEQNLDLGATPPGADHWLGTDTLGRDLFSRLLYGGRISLTVGLVATFVALTIGVTYGAVAGFAEGRLTGRAAIPFAAAGGLAGAVIAIFALAFGSVTYPVGPSEVTLEHLSRVARFSAIGAAGGGLVGAVLGFLEVRLDALMMRIVDILYALPFTIFVILLMVFFGRNIFLLFFAIGAVEWLTMARIVRGQVLSIKKMEYIEAARSLGLGRRRIIFRHIIPNVLGPIIVYTTLTIPAVMLLEAFLSFLGLGVQPPMSSWGVLIKDGAEKMEEFWWLLVFPGGAFSLTLFSLNFLGDGLRDALDVRSSKD